MTTPLLLRSALRCLPPLLLGAAALSCAPASSEDAVDQHANVDRLLDALSNGGTQDVVPSGDVSFPTGSEVLRTGTARMHHQVLFAPASVDGARGLFFAELSGDGRTFKRAVVFSANGGDTGSALTSYQDAWNERRSAQRADLLEAGFKEDGHYTDPGNDARSREELDDAIASYLRTPFGLASIVAQPVVGNRNGWVWFPWRIEAPGGALLQAGFDVVHLDAGGIPDLVCGFFEETP